MDVSCSTSLALGRPDTIIVIDPNMQSFFEFLEPRQASESSTLVVLLDRRRHDRRQTSHSVTLELRQGGRRAQPAEAARALMGVLGFAVLHRDGDRYVP